MATLAELQDALVNADRAGDAAAARALADAISQARGVQSAKTTAVRAGESIGGIPRQLGLTARYGVEGLAGLAQIGTEPIRALMESMGAPKMQPLQQAASGALDRLGLPSPQGADERVIGDASRLMAGGAGLAGAARGAANVLTGVPKTAAAAMGANPGTQAISGAGAGLAGGSVREGGGGELNQFAASLLGGLAAPAAAGGAMAAVNAGGNLARRLTTSPQQIDGILKMELGKVGVKWEDLGAAIKVQLRKDAEGAIYSGQPIDQAALRRLADYRAIGATPQLGDITQEPRTLTMQRNLAKQLANTRGWVGGADLPNIDNVNARRMLSALEETGGKSPLDAYSTGQAIIGRVKGKDAGLSATENALYAAARDSEGRAIPLARGQFVNTAFENLARENKTAFLPEEISTMLNQISRGRVKVNGRWQDVPFTVDTIDTLKTTLSTASRSAKDGNVRAAISAVRGALEDAQPEAVKRTFGGQQMANQSTAQFMQQQDRAPADAMAAFNAARSAARERRTWQESAKFIEDALNDAAPDAFVKKHVIAAPAGELAKMRAELDKAPEALSAVKKQFVAYILERGRADSDVVKFSSAGMNDALRALGDRKLSLFFSPDEIQQIKSAVNVGRYMQSQPVGSAVNNSNTGALLLGRLSTMLDAASPVPLVGPMIAQPMQGGLLQLQARQMNNLGAGLLRAQPKPEGGGIMAPAAISSGLLFPPGLPPRDD